MRIKILAALAVCMVPAGCETGSSDEFGAVLGEILGEVATGETGDASALSTLEIDAALRQALEIGATRVSDQIGVTDGFWKDPQIQIPLPGRLGQVQDQLSAIGLSAPLDDLQLRMNRAAEQAVPAG